MGKVSSFHANKQNKSTDIMIYMYYTLIKEIGGAPGKIIFLAFYRSGISFTKAVITKDHRLRWENT